MSVVFDSVHVRTDFVFNCSKTNPRTTGSITSGWIISEYRTFFPRTYTRIFSGVGLKFKNGKTVCNRIAFCNLLFFLAYFCCREREWKTFWLQDRRKVGWRKRQRVRRPGNKAGEGRKQRVWWCQRGKFWRRFIFLPGWRWIWEKKEVNCSLKWF